MNAVGRNQNYTLKQGKAAESAQVMRERSLPLLKAAGMDAVAFGRFYGREEWTAGPREAVLTCIEAYMSVVIETNDDLLAALRRL